MRVRESCALHTRVNRPTTPFPPLDTSKPHTARHMTYLLSFLCFLLFFFLSFFTFSPRFCANRFSRSASSCQGRTRRSLLVMRGCCVRVKIVQTCRGQHGTQGHSPEPWIYVHQT